MVIDVTQRSRGDRVSSSSISSCSFYVSLFHFRIQAEANRRNHDRATGGHENFSFVFYACIIKITTLSTIAVNLDLSFIIRIVSSFSESLGSSAVTTKPKRRAPLLKRKALTTGFFDNKGKDDKEKGESRT